MHMDAELVVDLKALASNYRRLAAISAPACCAAVLKANAYGLGAGPIARSLQTEGCRHFFVATWEEAVSLDAELDEPNCTIFVLSALLTSVSGTSGRNLVIPVLNSPEDIEIWRELDNAKPVSAPCALQIDTGMRRLGISRHADLDKIKGLDVRLILSHLACADDVRSSFTRIQARRFATICRAVPTIPSSLANSSGIFRGSELRHSMVRPGAALYGINPTPEAINPMQPVVYLSAPILQVQELRRGETTGYGLNFTAPSDMIIATVRIGYADGIPRSSLGGILYISGQEAPIIGRISMDLVVIDVERAKDKAHRGVRVEILGANRTIDVAAKEAGTIGYEILTSQSSRLQRFYAEGIDYPRRVCF